MVPDKKLLKRAVFNKLLPSEELVARYLRVQQFPSHPATANKALIGVNGNPRLATNDMSCRWDCNVTLLIYALRWLTGTLPHNQQSSTYRERQVEMQEMLRRLSATGFAG